MARVPAPRPVRARRALALSACLALAIPFLALRWIRIDSPPDPQADEGVYLNLASHYADHEPGSANWVWIPRRGQVPARGEAWPSDIAQPGAGALYAWARPLAPGDGLRAARLMALGLQALALALLALALARRLGTAAGAGAVGFTALDFAQIGWGSLAHTETPMLLCFSACLAALAWPGRLGSALAGAAAGAGTLFRTNGIFLPLALAFHLWSRRRDLPRAWAWAAAGALAAAAPILIASAVRFGSPLASASGDLLWSASLEDFRAPHAAPLGPAHLLRAIGWSGWLWRLPGGAWSLARRMVEMDHGRAWPALMLGLWGAWRLRRRGLVRVAALGTLPSLLVAAWTSPVAWSERFVLFAFPLLYGLAGYQLSWCMRRLGLRRPAARAWALAGAGLVLALPYLPPHRSALRQWARRAEARAEWRAEQRELDSLEALARARPAGWTVATAFAARHWRTRLRGLDLPLRPHFPGLARMYQDSLGVRPDYLILSRDEEDDAGEIPGNREFLAGRVIARLPRYALFSFDAPGDAAGPLKAAGRNRRGL